jgi:uncharacterized low-complexity protein
MGKSDKKDADKSMKEDKEDMKCGAGKCGNANKKSEKKSMKCGAGKCGSM